MNAPTPKILLPVSLGLLASLLLALDTSARVFVATNSTWRYFKGTSEASTPTNAWRELDFDDSAWPVGAAPFHFGTNAVGGDDTLTGGTILSDMRSNYTCLFLRQKFVLPDTNAANNLVLNAWIDDGLAIWISGQRARNPLSAIGLAYSNTATATREGFNRNALVLSNVVGLLRPGTNVLCLQAFNRSLTDEDFRIDVELVRAPGIFALATNTYSVREDGLEVVMRVVRTGMLDAGMSVSYATANGTAMAGSDYEAVSGTLVFAEGQTEQTITVRIFDDALSEGPEEFQLQLSNPGEGATLGSVSNATVQIIDLDEPPPFLFFATNAYTVAEAASQIVVRVVGTGVVNPGATVDYATTNLTAIAGLHYTAVAGRLTFAPGETNQTIVVPILNNGLVDGTKSFQVILSNPSNAVVATPRSTTVSITDNDVGVQFVFATYSVAEDAGAVLLGVVRGDDGTLPVTVDLATTDLTATSGLDYTRTTTTFSFAGTERFKLVAIPILNDNLQEPNETFRVTLTNPVGATLGSETTTTVTIVDNEQGVQFEAAGYTVAEDAGAAFIGVLRGDDGAQPVTVDYATADVSATNGLDYTATNGTLHFAAGEKVRPIAIPILNDGVREGTKSFRVALSNPSGGATLGSRTNVLVSIQDNDPGVGFELATDSVFEKAGQIILTVLRGNDGALGPITVDYATADGTARAGMDYEAVSGTLEFQENETVKSLTIPILGDALAENTETFSVTLSNPTGGAALGRASISVQILDNYPTLIAPYDARLAIWRKAGVTVLDWTGDAVLQRADRVTGPWQTLTGTKSPVSVQSPLPAAFYRVKSSRPVSVYVPSTYDGQTSLPLVILLHGYGNSGQGVEAYMQLRPWAEARGFLYCYPDGIIDVFGSRCWNAHIENAADLAAFQWPDVDDVAFLRNLIQEIGRHFAVDRKRVYLIGHSNGSAMGYRMACEAGDLIAGIASVAGVRPLNGHCQPSEPVNILHIHGTADSAAQYWGGAITHPPFPWNSGAFPGAVLNLQNWAGYNGARDPVTDPGPSMDLDLAVSGLDTVITRYTNCPPGGAVELWTINGGAHRPTLSSEFAPRVIDWLLAHPKP